ncbi:hypothetical protein LshimejAT787_1501260 [Lyophyllum shimeji]|uniref:CCHC-type domain-containing protein n=1 Tax=Lyophyllum shimeji TaxID=47721 RepID=A0A9P3PVX2_LYOSH|nr:hypothetical protein LshimejAT787_1501260 [Lyophyllum shimeji]
MSTFITDGSTSFPRLTHTNYAEWAMRMEAVLVRQGYWDLFLEDAVSGPLDPKELKDVKRRMAEARASMILRVDDSQLPHMVDPNPKVVWDTLAKVHRARGFGSRLHLRRAFITATMTEAPEVKEEEKESVAMAASATSKRGANVVCFSCGELGHFVADCKTRIKHFKMHETIAAKASLEDAEEENFAF